MDDVRRPGHGHGHVHLDMDVGRRLAGKRTLPGFEACILWCGKDFVAQTTLILSDVRALLPTHIIDVGLLRFANRFFISLYLGSISHKIVTYVCNTGVSLSLYSQR